MLKALKSYLRLYKKHPALIDSPAFLSKYFPRANTKYHHVKREEGEDPVPPKHLWLGYGSSEREYVESGKADLIRLIEILNGNKISIDKDGAVLDFGCGAGRMARHLKSHFPEAQCFASDVSAPHIEWTKLNLAPDVKSLLHTSIPPTPFRDGMFDLIYAGSVFTHMDEFLESWLQELHRILRQNGIAYLTFHDEKSIEAIKSEYVDSPLHEWAKKYKFFRELTDSPEIAQYQVVGFGADSNIFMNRAYIELMVHGRFTILDVVPKAYGYQTAYLLSKE